MAPVTSEKYEQIINRVNLSALKGKSIFITGGTGFFGYWLLKLFNLLNTNGFQIRITLLSRNPEIFLKNNPEYNSIDWLNWVKGDVLNYPFTSEKFDMFIHGAANTKPLGFEKPVTVFNEIVAGTNHVLEHIVASRAERVLIISSGAVYGEVSKDIPFIPENLTTAPESNYTENVYGEAKRASEMLAYSYGKENGFEVITARCFAFAGFGIGSHLILNILIRQALNDKELRINGSGLARRSFLHGQDLAVWLLKLLADGKSEPYNVGSDKAYSIIKLAELVRDILAPEKKVVVLGTIKQERRLNYVPSIAKAISLGLNVWTTIEESIKETQTPNLKTD
ncbi:MAG: NAD(P)-dependent oxidoreductase [Bacteroidetes bacterium]|nr:NAD(P)-dependent oxidoreductase [Bacteroidota bacterium]